MCRYFGLLVMVAAAAALPTPSEKETEETIELATFPFMSSIMLPLTEETAAKLIKDASEVMIPSPQFRSVMITGEDIAPKLEEVLEKKEDPIVMEVKPEMIKMSDEEKEEPKIEDVIPEEPKEETKKPETVGDKFSSYIKVPAFSSLLPTFSWPNWGNILPLKWPISDKSALKMTRDINFPKDSFTYVMI